MKNQTGEDQDGIARGLAMRAGSSDALIQKQAEFLEQQGTLQAVQLDLLNRTKVHLEGRIKNIRLRNLWDRSRIIFKVVVASVALTVAGISLALHISESLHVGVGGPPL